MATRTTALDETNATDAQFRAWITEIHNALVAFGWVRTSDTGQIDYTTVLKPAGSGAVQGYAVYRMDDSLQTTCPIFMKLRFGATTQTAEPGIRVTLTIGGTDGAGTLTGAVTPEYYLNNNTGAGGTSNMRTSGTSSSFRFCWRWASTTRMLCFMVERDLDSSGNETSLGVNLLICYGNSSIATHYIDNETRTVGTAESRWYAFISAQSSQSQGGNTGVSPVRTVFGLFRNPMKGALLYAKADFTDQTTQTVTHYGASHTYLTFNPATSMNINGINTTSGVMMLWE